MAKRTKIGITLTEDTIKKLEELCKILGMDKSYAISVAIHMYMEQEEIRRLRGTA